jgi:hypothetical protein
MGNKKESYSCTIEQTHWQSTAQKKQSTNKTFSNIQYTVYVYKVIAHWTQWKVGLGS